MSTRDFVADPRHMVEELDAAGFVHLRGPVSWPSFRLAAQGLGAVVLETDIRIDRDRASNALKPEELWFHNDNPEIEVIGWYCVEQDTGDGTSLLLDTRDVPEHFSPAELEVLRSIELRYPDLERHDPDRGIYVYRKAPLLSPAGRRHQVYYAPWHHLSDDYDEEQRRALARFEDWLRGKERSGPLAIRLAPGEGLLIDNRRLLHGRGAIAPDSRRLLKRVWVRFAAGASAA